MNLDWGDGDYSPTGRQLEPVALAVVRAAGLKTRDRVLDVGCGDGNAALEAARHGATVSGIDPSSRLVAVARQRAEAEGLTASFAVGEAALIDAPDGAFDVLFAIFSVIFAEDARAASNEMLRVTKAGGRLFITSWIPVGAMHEVLQAVLSEGPPPPPSPWQSVEGIEGLFADLPVDVEITEATVPFEAASPEACFRQWEEQHPFWRALRGQHPDWAAVTRRSVEVLTAHNEDPTAFRATSHYRIITLKRHA
jgi:SAM-dependent methyltransferase